MHRLTYRFHTVSTNNTNKLSFMASSCLQRCLLIASLIAPGPELGLDTAVRVGTASILQRKEVT